MSLPRLPHSVRTKRKISQKLKGRPKSPEHRAKIAAAMTGRRHSPVTVALLTEKRRARPKLTVEELLAECRKSNKRRKKAEIQDRFKQRAIDMAVAAELGLEDLRLDVKRSWGFWRLRRMSHPKVSDGYSGTHKRVMWTPFRIYLRQERGFQ